MTDPLDDILIEKQTLDKLPKKFKGWGIVRLFVGLGYLGFFTFFIEFFSRSTTLVIWPAFIISSILICLILYHGLYAFWEMRRNVRASKKILIKAIAMAIQGLTAGFSLFIITDEMRKSFKYGYNIDEALFMFIGIAIFFLFAAILDLKYRNFYKRYVLKSATEEDLKSE